jgi:hypothetical protein
MGISACTAEAVRAAKLAAWKVMLQDWRDVGLHTTVCTANRNEHARDWPSSNRISTRIHSATSTCRYNGQ